MIDLFGMLQSRRAEGLPVNFWFVSSLALLKETSLGLLVGWRLAVSIIYSTFKRAGGARTVEGHNSGIIGFNDRDLIAMILGLCASLCIYMFVARIACQQIKHDQA